MKKILLMTLILSPLSAFANINVDECVVKYDDYTYQKRLIKRESNAIDRMEVKLENEKKSLKDYERRLSQANRLCLSGEGDLDDCISINTLENQVEAAKKVVYEMGFIVLDRSLALGDMKSKLIYTEMSMDGFCKPNSNVERESVNKQCQYLGVADSYYCRDVQSEKY
ncbi:putative exported protein [Halobacteriovorax marinus SJ]|uniref:Exported protein n=1 Tax=Halobacteriovorax marinus (strain ATCC BAA-682 / DSM 15412 / SJ) TaxID=862908 RepID=E1WX26_HALMS|nr:hypothetical protein [Halobacteriovorax marinus]CBW25727.1 putative exported protein [Halobacteriovorax marinus SJ]